MAIFIATGCLHFTTNENFVLTYYTRKCCNLPLYKEIHLAIVQGNSFCHSIRIFILSLHKEIHLAIVQGYSSCHCIKKSILKLYKEIHRVIVQGNSSFHCTREFILSLYKEMMQPVSEQGNTSV